MGIPNDSARPQKRVCNVDCFADVLYWHPSEFIDWAYVLVQQTNSGSATYKALSFEWELGFRAGVGYNMGHDRWDTQFYYTHYEADTSDSAHSSTGGIYSAFLGNKTQSPLLPQTYQRAKIKWNLNYNIFDWDLGRSYFVSKSLVLRPLVGLKGGWIDQSLHSKWYTDNLFDLGIRLGAKENLKNEFAGIGPKGGFTSKWILGKSSSWFFSLFGDFSAAYLWGDWEVKDHFIDIYDQKDTVKVPKRRFGSLVVQAFMGVGFDVNFRHDRSHFSCKAGWEVQDWFDQYQIFDNGTGAHMNDLILQGLTVDMRLDF